MSQTTLTRMGSFKARQLACLPIPVLIMILIALCISDQRISYESPRLLMVLNFVFSTVVSLAIAYLIGRNFMVKGYPGLLLLGCGVVVWGGAGLLGAAAGMLKSGANGFNANVLVTIHNTCVWFSALCHLGGAAFTLRSKRHLNAPVLWLAVGYAMAVIVVAIVTIAALQEWTPIFFVQGQGGTVVRQVVLGSAIAMFILTVALLYTTNRQSWSVFSYWYALGLLLTAVGLSGVMAQSAAGSPLGWMGPAILILIGLGKV